MRRIPVVLLVLVFLFAVPWWTLGFAGSVWPVPVTIAGTVLFAVALVGFPPMMVLGHGRRGLDLAALLGDTTLGVVWVLCTWSLLGNLLRLVLMAAGVPDPATSRVVAIAVVVVAAALLPWGYAEARRVPRVRRADITVPRLGRGLDGLRVAVVTDTHFGALDRTRWAERITEVVNGLEPDIVCHVGDLADGGVGRRRDQVAPLAAVRARLAKFYVTGNHEYFSEAPGWLGHMASIGWEPLHNKHLVVERDGDALIVAGVDDATAEASKIAGHKADLAAALAGADPDLPVLLLAHQPKQVRAAVAAGVDLQLSGHTHGGQIWPFGLLVRLDQGTVRGLSRPGPRTQLYTSRGSGFWGPPFRVFAPSEISLLTLTAGHENRTAP
jgi:predicted MPP superfamily phosphohydrolase